MHVCICMYVCVYVHIYVRMSKQLCVLHRCVSCSGVGEGYFKPVVIIKLLPRTYLSEMNISI